MQHEKFHYKTIDDVRAAMKVTGAEFPLSEDISVLGASYDFRSRRAANRVLFQPMEASDSESGGGPCELTFRRYGRYAEGGPGILWFEAVSIAQEARASRNQLYMCRGNLDRFKRLVEFVKTTCMRQNGFEPILIIQSAHSGRYSKPEGVPAPLIAENNPLFEGENPIAGDRIISDEKLAALPALFGESARLAAEAGFDGVDIKACHRYLLNELLCAHTRGGDYGGSFENRTRLMMQAFEAAVAAAPSGFMLTARLNVYDGFPFPYGFGASQEGGPQAGGFQAGCSQTGGPQAGGHQTGGPQAGGPQAGGSQAGGFQEGSPLPDLTEPLRLIGMLREKYKLELINITAGNPYVNPHVSRPYDKGNYVPEEHPFEGVARITGFARAVQEEFPDVAVACSGLSYLRGFSDRLAAGMVGSGSAAFAGFGRMALAYPDFPRDLLAGRGLDTGKVCLTCGQCARLLRAGRSAGCVIRDSEVYRLADGR
ncbi:MAG: flavin oxidoreductase/NADH oxidase [Clostridiales bacterium]|nr:flavin oxidoreductase/NADH oxidase [Clostridiales bacterium]